MPTTTLSSVITDWGAKLTTCSRRSTSGFTRSMNGVTIVSPGSSVRLERPSRSPPPARACGITRIARDATISTNTTITTRTISAAMGRGSFLEAFHRTAYPQSPNRTSRANRRPTAQPVDRPAGPREAPCAPEAVEGQARQGRSERSGADRGALAHARVPEPASTRASEDAASRRPSTASVHHEGGGSAYLHDLDALADVDDLVLVVAPRSPHLAALNTHAADALVVGDAL